MRVVDLGSRVLLSWLLILQPIEQQLAWAQVITTNPDQADSFGTREDYLINQRAERLGNPQADTTPIRSPNTTPDDTPVRTPRLMTDELDAVMADRAAERIQALSTQEIVNAAQSGSDLSQSIYQTANPESYTLEAARAEPGTTATSGENNKVNLGEVFPNYSPVEVQNLDNLGHGIYGNARADYLRGVAEQNERNLKRQGCRTTRFLNLYRQDIGQAPTSATHRILKVEFYELRWEPIPNTDPVQYQLIKTPTTYRAADHGEVKLARPTIGESAQDWWEERWQGQGAERRGFAIHYIYTPYQHPAHQNYFTYNQRLAFDWGGGPVVQPEAISYYGIRNNAFTPTIVQPVQDGVRAVYLSADLYRTDVVYSPETPGVPCPPDPPTTCIVQALSGEWINWCPGTPGAGIIEMYDDSVVKSANQEAWTYTNWVINNSANNSAGLETELSAGVSRALNASGSGSTLIQTLGGTCTRDVVSTIETWIDNSYHNERIEICSETLVNPFPEGCILERSFGLSFLGNTNFLTIKAYNRQVRAVSTGNGGGYCTYEDIPIPVSGTFTMGSGGQLPFPVFGAPLCPGSSFCPTPPEVEALYCGGGCSGEPPNQTCSPPVFCGCSGGGQYFVYEHNPMSADPKNYAVNRVYIDQGGTAAIGHYGRPNDRWLPQGTISANGTVLDLRINAEIHAVTVNTFISGTPGVPCERYIDYAADGFCQGAQLTCLDATDPRTVGTVTFGHGTATSGVLDILKKWGSDTTAEFPDYDRGLGEGPTASGPALILLDNQMCWKAYAHPFTTCSTMGDLDRLQQFTRNGQIWATDCHLTQTADGRPIQSCTRQQTLDWCDERWVGLYTGVCYNPSLAFDCGTDTITGYTVLSEEKGDVCTGLIRCLGTECHRPSLAGDYGDSFAEATAGMEALNMMKGEMVCAETGEKAQNTTDTCTPVVFGGKKLYCKIPIGNEIGLTPNCCNEAENAANQVDTNWIQYLKAVYLLYKISENRIVQNYLGMADVYNAVSKTFGQVASPVTNAYRQASEFVTNTFVKPLQSGFDNLFGSFGIGGSSSATAPAQVAVDATAKRGLISGAIDKMYQMTLQGVKTFLESIVGPDLTRQIITTEGGRLVLTPMAQNIAAAVNLVLLTYSLLRIIGHIIFACEDEEYEWAMNNKWRLCTYAGDCCNKKVLFTCVEKRKLYCCYKSIASRVIAEQIIRKCLVPGRCGYRQQNGQTLKKCNVNCTGFTPYELAQVDWAQVDLSEWLDALIQSGLFNPTQPSTVYHNTTYSIPQTHAVGRVADTEGAFNQDVSATKTIQGIQQNLETISDNTRLLRSANHCYVSNDKMPFTYPDCPQEGLNP